MAEDGTLRVTERESASMRNLGPAEIREMWESECLRRKLCERRIEMLEKQLLEVEQKYLISIRLNETIQTAVASLEANTASLINDWVSKEKMRVEQCKMLMAENVTLNNKTIALMEREEETGKDLLKLAADNKNLKDSLGANQKTIRDYEATVCGLKNQVDKLTNEKDILQDKLTKAELERNEWREKETGLFKETCALEEALQEKSTCLNSINKQLNHVRAEFQMQLENKDDNHKKKVEQLSNEFARKEETLRLSMENEKQTVIKKLKGDFEALLEIGDKNFNKLKAEHEFALKKLSQMDDYKRRLQHQMVLRFQQILQVKYGELLNAVQAAENSSIDISQHLSKTFGSTELLAAEQLLNDSIQFDNHHNVLPARANDYYSGGGANEFIAGASGTDANKPSLNIAKHSGKNLYNITVLR